MCGIFGSINVDLTLKDIDNISNTMKNRGPDDNGFYQKSINNYKINFVHNRLSILDIEKGKQPMISADDNIVIIYNGEIYNYKDLRDKLISKGYIFVTNNSDTEVLIHGYKEWGKNLPFHLDGMWSFAIIDKKKNQIFFSRDRFGEKPLFYYYKDKQFYFSSELSAFQKIKNINLEYNYNNFKKYCAYGFFPGDTTPFKYIKKLEQGSNLFFDLNKFSFYIKKYYEYNIEPDYNRNEKYWTEKLFYAIKNSVKSRLISDVPVGILLSGGLDSSIIAFHANEFINNNFKTYSISFEDEDFDETKYVEHIVNIINTDHRKTLLETKDAFHLNEQLMDKLSEPLSDSSLISSFKLCKFIKNDSKVILGGDSADELFGGYDTLRAIKYAKIVSKLKINKLHPAINFLVSKFPSNYNIYLNNKFKMQRFLRFSYKNLSIANCQWLSPLSIDEINYIFNDKNNLDEIYSEAIDLWDKKKNLDEIDKSNEFYCNIFLPNQILVKTDRISMSQSLELRTPFLSNEITEISRMMPHKFKINKNISKYIIKKTYEKIFGKEFVYRKKMGFSSPLSRWFKNKDIKFNLKSNFLMKNENFINSKLKEHILKKQDNRIFLWNILHLENFMRKN